MIMIEANCLLRDHPMTPCTRIHSRLTPGRLATRGFTLIELIVVITILTILGTIGIVSVNDYCIDSVVKNIFVDIEYALYVPNSFEPESKALGISNFIPKGFNLETYKIWIYDYWGNQLWYSDKLHHSQPLEGWDGTYNGVPMKMDSYVWKIEASFLDGSKWEGQSSTLSDKKSIFGNVLLIR